MRKNIGILNEKGLLGISELTPNGYNLLKKGIQQ